ncbi:hypothetical protein AD950_00525 [Gluconobacter oxydans]|nr:hypothetical protein [Gluconobacter oxydans]KXV67017.1 hypothetical protein AD950_00525 [Gluconobacter oxydans]
MIQILTVCMLPVSLIGLAILIPWLLKRLEGLSADQKGETSSSALSPETDVILTELMTSCPSQSHHHATFFGRPPFAPFRRAAAAFASLDDDPPARPICAAIQRLVP